MADPKVRNRLRELWAKKEVAEDRRISLSELEREVGVGRSTLYRWLNDDVSRYDDEVIVALCDYFGVELEDLLEYTPPLEQSSESLVTVTPA